jgi:hypothetical protein
LPLPQGYQLLSQITGEPVGGGVNVNLYEVTADFAQLVPELVLS